MALDRWRFSDAATGGRVTHDTNPNVSSEQWEQERQTDGTFRVRCSRCGKSVSSALTAPVVIRAWVECPECIEAHGRLGKLAVMDYVQHKPSCPHAIALTLDLGPGWVTQSVVKPCNCGLSDLVAAILKAGGEAR
jgi:hypothetical protein